MFLCAGAAATGALFEPGAWYAALDKPAATPPNWVFPVAWTALYVMIGWSGFRIWRSAGWSWALGAWGTQLVLNALWSWLFFGLHEMGAALVEIRILGAVILVTIVLAWRHDRWASALLVPFLLWVGFASWLNLELWMRNG